MNYFYDKNGRYIGANNVGRQVEGAVGSTRARPEADQRWDAQKKKWVDNVTQKKPSAPVEVDYATKVAGYSLHSTKAALRFVRDPEKRAILNAHLSALRE